MPAGPATELTEKGNILLACQHINRTPEEEKIMGVLAIVVIVALIGTFPGV